MNLVHSLGEEGRTLLVSSHILHEVEAMTERVALMRSGRLMASGRIPELRSGLLREPYRVRVVVEDPRNLAVRIMDREEVIGVRITEAGLILETPVPEKTIDFLTALASRGEANLLELDVEDRGLEAIFRYTVDR